MRVGRRPGNQDTREAILTAARRAFAEKGFDATSIRTIASAAAVDPALVHHYFGTKDQLFLASVQAPIDPSEIIPQALSGDRDRVGERLVAAMLRVWDSPVGGAAAALIRSAVSNDAMLTMIREFVVTQMLRRIAKELKLPPDEAPMRTALTSTHIAGLIMTRYILKLEPIASAPPALLARLIGANIQQYLTGQLDLSPAPPTAPPLTPGRATPERAPGP